MRRRPAGEADQVGSPGPRSRRAMPGAPPTVTGHIHLTAAAVALFALPLGALAAAPTRRALAAVCLLLAYVVVAAFLLGPPLRPMAAHHERVNQGRAPPPPAGEITALTTPSNPTTTRTTTGAWNQGTINTTTSEWNHDALRAVRPPRNGRRLPTEPLRAGGRRSAAGDAVPRRRPADGRRVKSAAPLPSQSVLSARTGVQSLLGNFGDVTLGSSWARAEGSKSARPKCSTAETGTAR